MGISLRFTESAGFGSFFGSFCKSLKMPTHSFTDRWLKTVGPFDATKEFADGACPNLRLRVGKHKKSFSVMIGSASSRRRIPIGCYPQVTLLQARKKATLLLSDPRAAGGGRPGRSGPQKAGTVEQLFEFVIDAMAAEGKLASIPDYKMYLLDSAEAAVREFGPSTLARNVTSAMATDWLSKFHERGRSTRLPRAILSAAFNRGLKADNDPTSKKDRTILFALASNPVASVGGPTQSNTRDRSLTFEEMSQFWGDLQTDYFTEGLSVVFRMIISMGGVRVTEVVRSEKSWWKDNGGWRTLSSPKLALPKTKNGLPHDLPVTKCAAEVLIEARNLADENAVYLFPSPYKLDSPRSLDNLSSTLRQYCSQHEFEPFTPRDIRRSMKNLLLDNDVPQTEVDIWHNHGKNADVARRNYDRAQYEHAKDRVSKAIDELIGDF